MGTGGIELIVNRALTKVFREFAETIKERGDLASQRDVQSALYDAAYCA